MSKIWHKPENKILIILLLFSISIGLWNNFRQLWMQDNGINATEISQIISFGTLFCVVGILIFSRYIKLNRIKNFKNQNKNNVIKLTSAINMAKTFSLINEKVFVNFSS